MRTVAAGFIVLVAILGALGAAAAAAAESSEYSSAEPAKYEQLRREHWAFQPVRHSQPPKSSQDAWAKSDIDRFILAKLEEHKLKPSKSADRRTLIRRATFDLTGLPPTPEQVEAFVNDSSSKAFEKVVDRLLASPAFGVRWGRHWLDVARYAESTGMSRNAPLYYAWRYRDYVIDALNADKPFNRFIMEQISGDLLSAETDAQRDAQLIATGFLAMGPKDINERNPLQFTLNSVDEQIDTTTRAFLGMTVSCARCHDHKFDPIPAADYYAMAGIFRSTVLLAGIGSRRGPGEFYKPEEFLTLSPASLPSSKPAKRREAPRVRNVAVIRVAEMNAGDFENARRRQQLDRRQAMRLQRRGGVGETEIRNVALGVRDGRIPADSNIFIRGELDERGPVVPRGAIHLPGMEPIGPIPSDRSGRLELAGWIASERNPLTARVMVNRIWLHLFGQGIVRSVDNFGTTGEPPTHPELLDHLARQFQGDGWSVKRTIRRIMLTSVYQQGGTYDESKFAVDPDNLWLWRMSPRRLEGEAIRDAILAIAGTIDRARPVGSDVIGMPPAAVMRPDRFGRRFGETDTRVRSVYLTMLRGSTPAALDAFDLADNTQVTGCRDVTTVAPQALFMMNDPFVLAQAKAFGRRLTSERSGDSARVDRAYSLALGRMPNDAERLRALKYVRSFAKDVKSDSKQPSNAESDAWSSVCQALFASAEFRYVN